MVSKVAITVIGMVAKSAKPQRDHAGNRRFFPWRCFRVCIGMRCQASTWRIRGLLNSSTKVINSATGMALE
jgi:hypothetical protein